MTEPHYMNLGFPELSPVATLRSIAHLFGSSKSRCGIYLLKFTGERYYIGQALDVVRRFGQHRKNYDDIIGISFIPTPKKSLNEVEINLIKEAERLSIKLLNTVHATNIIGDTDLDLVISPESQTKWLESPAEWNLAVSNRNGIELPPHQVDRFANQFSKFSKNANYDDSLQLLRAYVLNCIPEPKVSEYSFWVVSCLPSTNKSTWPRLFCVSAGVMETFVVGYHKDSPEKVWGLLTVASDIFLEKYKTQKAILEHFPNTQIIERNYRDPGQHQITISISDLSGLKSLLENETVKLAAAALVLRVMRKRGTIYSKFHCKQLSDLATISD